MTHATGKPNLILGGSKPLCGALKHAWTSTCYATCKRCIRILRARGRALECIHTPEWKVLQK